VRPAHHGAARMWTWRSTWCCRASCRARRWFRRARSSTAGKTTTQIVVKKRPKPIVLSGIPEGHRYSGSRAACGCCRTSRGWVSSFKSARENSRAKTSELVAFITPRGSSTTPNENDDNFNEAERDSPAPTSLAAIERAGQARRPRWVDKIFDTRLPAFPPVAGRLMRPNEAEGTTRFMKPGTPAAETRNPTLTAPRKPSDPPVDVDEVNHKSPPK